MVWGVRPVTRSDELPVGELRLNVFDDCLGGSAARTEQMDFHGRLVVRVKLSHRIAGMGMHRWKHSSGPGGALGSPVGGPTCHGLTREVASTV
jgi:hypothetical protein